MKAILLASIYALVGLTGAAGLIYQVVWQRYLARLVGAEITATAVILAVFLGGLSLGYLLCGRLSARLRDPMRGYGWLEGAIGVWAILFPQLFDLVSGATRVWSFSPPFWLALQGTFAAVVLLGVPTLCMGSTVPLLTRALSQTISESTRVHAWVYAVNTAGAFVGTLLAGFFFVPVLGLPSTLRWTAIVNLAAAVFFLAVSFFLKPAADEKQEPVLAPAATNPRRHSPRLLCAIAFLSGAYVMTLENVLIRTTNLTMGASSYSFSLVVAVFVLCIALGGFRVAARREFSAASLWRNQAAIAVSLLILFVTLDKWPYVGHLIRICFQPHQAGFWAYQAATLLGLLVVLAVPVTLIGSTLPLLFHEIKRRLSEVGLDSGSLFSWNALGCVAGSLVGGLMLFYVVNNDGVFLIAVLMVVLSTTLAAISMPVSYQAATAVMVAATLAFLWVKPFYREHRLAYGTFRFATVLPFSFAGAKQFYHEVYRDRPVRFYKDGPTGTVAVLEEQPEATPAPPAPPPDKPALSIVVNGKPDSNTQLDLETLKLCAHLPALSARNRTNALVIGLGTGVTAAELLLYPDIARVDVAEISPTVVEVMPLFGASTRDAHRNPRLRLRVGDAFRVLGRSREKWGLIVSEPSNPWTTGVDQLFTREFYRMVAAHLTEDGVFLQWLQGYSIDAKAYGIVLATVREQFKNCYVFSGSPGDLLILALPMPLTAEDREHFVETLAAQPAVGASLAEIRINDGRQLLAREMPALLQLADQFKQFGVETLDRPRLHYLAGYTAFTGQSLHRQGDSDRSRASRP